MLFCRLNCCWEPTCYANNEIMHRFNALCTICLNPSTSTWLLAWNVCNKTTMFGLQKDSWTHFCLENVGSQQVASCQPASFQLQPTFIPLMPTVIWMIKWETTRTLKELALANSDDEYWFTPTVRKGQKCSVKTSEWRTTSTRQIMIIKLLSISSSTSSPIDSVCHQLSIMHQSHSKSIHIRINTYHLQNVHLLHE